MSIINHKNLLKPRNNKDYYVVLKTCLSLIISLFVIAIIMFCESNFIYLHFFISALYFKRKNFNYSADSTALSLSWFKIKRWQLNYLDMLLIYSLQKINLLYQFKNWSNHHGKKVYFMGL